MNASIVTIDQLTKSFARTGMPGGRKQFPAVDGVSLCLARGRTLALVGESGSGKSTLARLLMKLDTPSAGAIRLHREGAGDRDIAAIPAQQYYRSIQMVFQDPYASLNPRKRVWQIVSAAAANLGGHSRAELRHIALQQLREVGLPDHYLDAFPDMLSGGQRQRVGIARALAARPDILVLDEPLSALDVSIQAQILNLLLDLQERLGLTYLFISHDLAVVRHIADDVAVLYGGRLVECGPVDAVIDAPRHPYTQELVDSALGSGHGGAGRAAAERSGAQAAGAARTGCNFLSRCARAGERCGSERPALQLDVGRQVACFQSI